MKEVIDSYTFLEISDQKELEQNKKIFENLNESKLIIISHYEEQEIEKNYRFFVVSFKRMILVIKEIRIKILQTLLSKKDKLEICFLFDTKKIFDDINDKLNKEKIKYEEIQKDEDFDEEIRAMNSNFFKIDPKNYPHNDILHVIKSSI